MISEIKNKLPLSFLFYCFVVFANSAQTPSDEVSLTELLIILDKGESILNKKIEMNEVNFDFNSTELNLETKNYVDNIFRLLNAIPEIVLHISGHTDNIGDSSVNIDLSRKRALVIYDYLILRGISEKRMTHEGFGAQRPIASNSNELGRSKNRRVEFEISRIVTDENIAYQLQDLIYLKEGKKIGAYDITIVDDYVHYYSFLDNQLYILSLEAIDHIQYSNGTTYDSKPTQDWIGNWYNEDSSTPGITKFKILKEGSDLVVQMWGKCHPKDCYWGEEKVSINSAKNNLLRVKWNPTHAVKEQVINSIDANRLKVTTNTTFIDNSGRNSYSSTEYFNRRQQHERTQDRVISQVKGKLDAFYLYGGYRRFNLKGEQIDFSFIDDSPSMDNVTNSIELNNGAILLGGGFEWKYQYFDLMVGVHGFLGKVRGVGFVPGVGYRILEKPKYILRPGAFLSIGRATVKLGDIENNDLFIQINEQQYFGESVSVKLRKSITTFQPHLALDLIERKARILIGYNLTLASGSERLLFSGDVDGEDVEEEKKLEGSGSVFLVDGQSQNMLPVGFDGLFFHISMVLR